MGLCMIVQMDAEVTRFSNDNSLIQDGQRYAGAVLESNTKITRVKSLLAGMSAQKTELPALIKALELGKDKMPLLPHVHGPIYRERGLFM